jgi:hypothetical protein
VVAAALLRVDVVCRVGEPVVLSVGGDGEPELGVLGAVVLFPPVVLGIEVELVTARPTPPGRHGWPSSTCVTTKSSRSTISAHCRGSSTRSTASQPRPYGLRRHTIRGTNHSRRTASNAADHSGAASLTATSHRGATGSVSAIIATGSTACSDSLLVLTVVLRRAG